MKLKLMCLAIVGAATTTAFSLSAQESKSQWSGVYTVEQAKRGEAPYMKKCAACHVNDLTGGADEYNPAPALVGAQFAENWNDMTLADLFTKIHTTMPQDDPGTLTPQEASDIVAFMLQKGNYPSGAAELPAQAESLKAYKFLAKKPGA